MLRPARQCQFASKSSYLGILPSLLALLFSIGIAHAHGPFGIHERTEPLERIDPEAPDDLPGFELETPAGVIRTFPSQNRIEWLARGETDPVELGSNLSLRSPTGIAATESHLWVADTANRRILRWTIENATIDKSSATVVQVPEFRRPIGLATHGRLLFIADSWSDRIFVLTDTGELQRIIGQHGSRPGFLSGPIDLLLHDDLLFVADSRNSRVQAFDPDDGSFAYEWGLHVIRPHEGEGRLHYPARLLLSDDRTSIGVTEPWEDRVQWFRRAETDEQVPQRLPLGADDFIHYGPGVDAYDRLIAITDPDTHTVRVFDLQLETPVLIGVVGAFGDAPGQFIHPGDVAFLPPYEARPLRLAVADRGNARIALYAIDWSADEPLRFRPKLASLLRTFNLLAIDPKPEHPIDPVAISALRGDRLVFIDGTNHRSIMLDHRLRISSVSPLPDQGDRPPSWSLASFHSKDIPMLLNRANARLVPLNGDGQVDPSRVLPADRPVDALVRDDEIFVVDQSLDVIVLCDDEGNPIKYIGSTGLEAGQFFKPASILGLPDGQVLVVDRGNHRLQFFDSDWTLTKVAGPRLYTQPATVGARAPQCSSPPSQAEPKSD